MLLLLPLPHVCLALLLLRIVYFFAYPFGVSSNILSIWYACSVWLLQTPNIESLTLSNEPLLSIHHTINWQPHFLLWRQSFTSFKEACEFYKKVTSLFVWQIDLLLSFSSWNLLQGCTNRISIAMTYVVKR